MILTCTKCGCKLEVVDVLYLPEENIQEPIFGCHCDDNPEFDSIATDDDGTDDLPF